MEDNANQESPLLRFYGLHQNEIHVLADECALFVLAVIDRLKPRSFSELAFHVGLPKDQLSRVCDRLRAARMIALDTQTGRIRTISLGRVTLANIGLADLNRSGSDEAVRWYRRRLVDTALPPHLNRLPDLAYNLLSTWNHEISGLFRRLDPVLWKETGKNPVLLLQQVSESVLQRAGADERYVQKYRRATDEYDSYLSNVTGDPAEMLVAYFGSEYALTDALPIYVGGRGVVAGDYLKACSDVNIPVVGVGLLYGKGVHAEEFNGSGHLRDREITHSFESMPVEEVCNASGVPLKVPVELREGVAWCKVWCVTIGRALLYLLDTNIAENSANEYRRITEMPYGRDAAYQALQQIVLGIGGVRALVALNLVPTVFHVGDRELIPVLAERALHLSREQGLSFEEALDTVRGSTVVNFWSDSHPPNDLEIELGAYCRAEGIDFHKLRATGHEHRFKHSLSSHSLNFDVSTRRHAPVTIDNTVVRKESSSSSEAMTDSPIIAIECGVHLPTWTNPNLISLYDQYLDIDSNQESRYPADWQRVHEIPDQELWQYRGHSKRRLIALLRERVTVSALKRHAISTEVRNAQELFDPEIFTLGLAHQVSTFIHPSFWLDYKERLQGLLSNAIRPLQIVMAVNPDTRSPSEKSVIEEMMSKLARDTQLSGRFLIFQYYQLADLRNLVQGVDLWVGTAPNDRDPLAGISRMKAAVNGTLNLTVPPRQFDNCHETFAGWEFKSALSDSADEGATRLDAIFALLELTILPLYYQRSKEGLPHGWLARMKDALATILFT